MLSAVMLLLFGATYALILWGRLRDAFRQQAIPVADITDVVDFAIGLVVLSMTVRFLTAVTILNWKVCGPGSKGAG
ncbi:MAG: hypothetical protein WD278_16695 [Pirellulales bacterium]